MIIAVVNKVAQVVTEFERQFLSILGLLDREILIHRVGRQMLKIVKEQIARDDPAHLEVIGKLYW